MSEERQPSIEENLAGIAEIIGQMEEPEVTLEESFALYQQGIERLKQCNAQLDLVEKKLLVLNEEGTLEEMQG